MSQEISNCFSLLATLKAINPIVNIVGAFIAALALFVAIYIPRRIMISQIYANLLENYRSPEMGGAILAIFHFYNKDCGRNVSNIAAEYEKKYDKQIKKRFQEGEEQELDFSKTLHFQRRLVAQFYFDMASLRYDRRFIRLPDKYMKIWFTPSEVKLLGIILHMAEPASKVFEDAGEVPPPPYEDEVLMNELIYKLYEEVRDGE